MATWADFATAEPSLASAIRTLVCQYGPGLGYLATVRPDGGPRIHPVSPVITDEGLFCFVLASPKRYDLDRDGRYSLHSFPATDSDDEAYLSGRATPVTDETRITHLATLTRAADGIDWKLYELTVDVAMLVHHETPTTSTRTVWKARKSQIPRARQNGPCATAADSVQ
ncbi:pyridoxamine 5'-phosphate oxidase family protein [Dactylosporangium sp. CA-233914]|uniref:pyridoxamine 5'-phosphate oxidase family protein n=1 Tax=Dactylosporangium sp. CA-233914 TaxID=3239934 RepID=UPI003D8F8EA1